MSINFYKEINLKWLDLIAKRAEEFRVRAYLVGGIVRDIILKNDIKDIDITVEGDAIEFCEYMQQNGDCEIKSVQENLRTVKVEFSSDCVIDIASTREEYYIKGGVLPVVKNFGCEVKKDVKRRDFTINTLALEITTDKKYRLIDYLGGYEDIESKKIRVLHDKSFIDDPSRIVRAVKFQMRLGFEIEQDTNELINEYLKNVDKTIPLERIKSELCQYFSINKRGLYKNIIDKKVYKLVSDKAFPSFNEELFNEINQFYNIGDKFFIYFGLLIIYDKFDNQRLNLTVQEKKILSETLELLKSGKKNSDYENYKKFKGKADKSIILYYLISSDKMVIRFLKDLQSINIEISGNDLIKMGLKPSKQFGYILDKVLEMKIEGKIESKSEEIEYVKQHFI